MPCTAGQLVHGRAERLHLQREVAHVLARAVLQVGLDPDVAPRPGISGRLNAKPTASFIPKSLPLIRLVMASMVWSFPRSSHGLSRMKIVALLV